MPLHGDTATFSLPAIVRLIHDEEKTGLLTVTAGYRSCSIYFRGGKIVFASGNTEKHLRLGELLKANELISEAKLEEMIAVAQAMDKRLGTVLIERDYISRDNLARLLVYQFKEVVSKTLSWNKATFTYADGLDGYVEDVHFELDPVRLVAEAEKWQGFRDLIPNDQVVFQIKPGAAGAKSMHGARELRVLLLLDGKRSVQQVIKETGYSRLAVYRSLAQLYSQSAIIRKDAARMAASQAAKKVALEPSTIVSLFQSLLRLIAADIASELGETRAAASIQSSLKQSAYYQQFLKAFQLGEDAAKNLEQMQLCLKKQGATLAGKDLIRGFNQVVASLMNEHRRFLGPRATQNTVKRVTAALEKVPDNQKSLAQTISRFLGRFDKGASLHSARKPELTGNLMTSGSAEARLPRLDLQNVGGSAIVSFYNEIFQIVISELETEVGAKARTLFQNIVRNSKYYDSIFSQFDPRSTAGSNALRIREHIKTQELRLSKQDLVTAFQQVLMSLLQEENRFLGEKVTRLTIARLGKRAAGKQAELKPLVDNITAFLEKRGAEIGG